MNASDYTNAIVLPAAAGVVFDALTRRIPEWWSRDFAGSSSREGDEFTVRFGPTFKTMRIGPAAQDRSVEWLCVAQRIVMPDGLPPLTNPSEWVGNTITWEIAPQADAHSRLTLTHRGLTPEVECWSVCEQGWDQTLKSLEKLIRDGTGQPFQNLDESHLARVMSQAAAE